MSTGTISGTLTYKPASTTLNATNVTVVTIPATTSATTDATGAFQIGNVPVGVYSVKFSGNAFATLQIDGVSVQATKTIDVSRLLTANNPITLTAPAATAPAGFGAQATLAVQVSGGTAPYTYSWVPAAANPTSVTLSSTTAASPTFTTGTLQQVLASGLVWGFGQVSGVDTNGNVILVPNTQNTFLSISAKQLAQMTYNFTCTVTDSVGFSKAVTVAVPPATLAQGSTLSPLGQIVIANIPGNSSAATLAAPSASTAVIHEASTANPWFIPDVKGNYTVTAGSQSLITQAASFVSANPDCGACHADNATLANVAGKFKDWANSAHGNHWFKYMSYDGSGNLVWNKDANGNYLQGPTGNPSVFWSNVGPMTTFEFGMTGAEGTHYSQSCIACHTTGYNALARNSGMFDQMASAPYTFPNLTNLLGTLSGITSQQVVTNGVVTTATYSQVTATPQLSVWNAIPASVQAFAGMQCESCHGPLGLHTTAPGSYKINGAIVAPAQEFNPATCAVCHDSPSNHDKVWLWRQSKHANLSVAVSEGAGGSVLATANPSNSCNRCHSAQGFVQYVKQLTGQVTNSSGQPIVKADGTGYWGAVIDPTQATVTAAGKAYLQNTLNITPDKVQPQTCGACHDPHTTGLRVEGNTPMLPAGFKVSGAGAGALCFVCHNSRNGAHGDVNNGVYYTSDLPGTTAATSIGAPHEACQGDVVAGKNAFFVGGYNPSPHLAVQDSCVGCHMYNGKAGGPAFTNTNHTWSIDSTACASCHGGAKDPVDGAALQSEFDDAVTELTAAVNTTAQGYLPGLYYKGAVANLQIPAGSTVTFVFGRSPGFIINFPSAQPNPDAASPATVNSLGTSASPAGFGKFFTDSGVSAAAFDQLKGNFAKTNWNYELVTQDGTRGIHNPSFTFAVLSATEEAILGSGTK
ncbi:MAG TPA: carboxypeptidase regulatory-like domain-containing protein [Myxococcales bacterium]|nr:carboxypeptidase regulatory-like domain-containing protein [Myxococcales bacterium]